MKSWKSLSVPSLLATAGLIASAQHAAPVFGADDGLQGGNTKPNAAGKSVSAKETLDQAAALLSQGKAVKARAMLMPLTTSSGLSQLANADRQRALALASNAGKRMKELSQVESSLQSSEHAYDTGDYRTAKAHALGVIGAPKATNEQVSAAKVVLAQVSHQQEHLAGSVKSQLQDGVASMKSGETAKAREQLSAVVRSGVTLNAEDQAVLDDSMTKLVDAPAALGMLGQPGVVRRQPQTPPVSPTPAPAPEPVVEDPVVEEAIAMVQPEQMPMVPEPSMQQGEPIIVVSPQEQPIILTQAQPQADPVSMARKWEAGSLLAEGDYAFSENRMVDAADRYGRLSNEFADQLTPDQVTHVQNRLAEARIRLGGNPGQARDVLQQAIDTNQVARQDAEAEFNNFLAQAQTALDRGDTQRARELATQARVRINSARNFFSNEEVDSYVQRANALMTSVDQREDTLRVETIKRQADENANAAATQAKQQSRDKAGKLNESIDRVRALQKEQKYEEALQVVEQNILFLDPTNPTGLLLRDVLADAVLYRQVTDINRERYRTYAAHDVENLRAAIAPVRILDYPNDWPSISDRRGTPVAFAEAEENRRALATLQGKRIPVNFNDTPMESAVSFLQAVTQLNIDVDWPSLESSAGINKQTPITLNLTNVPVDTVLNRIMDKVSPDPLTGAAWAINDGVLTIASKEQINRQKAMVIYDIRDLIIEVPDYPNAPRLDLNQALQDRSGGGGGGQNPFQNQDALPPPRRTIQERSQEILDILTTNVDRDGWRENGGDTGYIQQLNGLLIITNTPSNHRSINGLLSKLREYRAMQINVETRFLLVNQDFFEQIGFDLDVYFNAQSNVVRAAQATRPTTRASDFFDFINSNGYRDTFPQPPSQGANNNRTALGGPWSPVAASQGSLNLSQSLLSSDFAQEVFRAGPAMGIGGQFLDDVQVDFLIKATQADRRTVTLTAPRLTFTNGQISNIFVGSQISYVQDLEPVTNDSAVGFDPTPGTITDGVSLRIDGTISADRRYVTMNIITGISKLEALQPLPVTAIAGGQLVNSASAQSFIQLPTTSVTRIETTVTVPDQGTILLGGQRLTTDSEVESGVPVLSKVPILNRFFTNRVMTRTESTLLILLKPTILIQNEEEDRNFPGLQDSLRIPFGG